MRLGFFEDAREPLHHVWIGRYPGDVLFWCVGNNRGFDLHHLASHPNQVLFCDLLYLLTYLHKFEEFSLTFTFKDKQQTSSAGFLCP